MEVWSIGHQNLEKITTFLANLFGHFGQKTMWWKVGLSVFSHFAFWLFCEAKTASDPLRRPHESHLDEKAFNTKKLTFPTGWWWWWWWSIVATAAVAEADVAASEAVDEVSSANSFGGLDTNGDGNSEATKGSAGWNDSILNSSIGSCNKIQLYVADAVFVLDTKNVFVPLFAGILLCLPCLRTKKAYDKDFQLSKVRQLGPTLASFKGSVIFVPASNFGKMDGIIYPPKFCKLFPFWQCLALMLIIWLSLQYFTAQCIKIYKKDSFETYQEILKEIGKIGNKINVILRNYERFIETFL